MDQDLARMRRIQTGDEAAFAALYDRHATIVYSVAMRILRRPSDAEDAAQQAWVQVWTSAKEYDPWRGPVVAWILKIVRSRAIDLWRRTASRRKAEEAAPAPTSGSEPDPAASAARIQAGERVRRALDGLEDRERRVLEIAYFEGLSQSEIAARLGAPLGSVKSWTRRGLLKLKDMLPSEDLA